MSRSLLKRAWQASPQTLRLMFCTGLCFLRARKRLQETIANGPIFVCGAFSNSSGLAHSARLYVENCRKQGKLIHALDITDIISMPHNLEPVENMISLADISAMQGPGTVVIHANPPQFQLSLCALGKNFLQQKRVVGYWAWELDTLPAIWKQALDYVDAVEVPSAFVANTLRQYTRKPISIQPHLIPTPKRRKTDYAANGILHCLYILDAGSSWERKNPHAALEAFAKAFKPGEAELTFKINNADAEPERFTAFATACSRIPGVRIITETLSMADMENLYLDHDIYLSLHRSEGYGLTIKEAMNYGLHAVATGWSGNMDFMTGELAHTVPYNLMPLTVKNGPYKGLNARWAQPDVEAAAGILHGLKQKLCGNLTKDADCQFSMAASGFTSAQVAIMVLNYNNAKETLACLASLYGLAEKPGMIMVVDNNSTDNSVEEIYHGWRQMNNDVLLLHEGKEDLCLTNVTAVLYKLNENRGYGAGNNAGIRLARRINHYQAYWILNNDTRVATNSLQALCTVYNSERGLCLIGSTIVFLHDRQTIQCTAGSRVIGCLGLTFALNAGKNIHTLGKIKEYNIEKNLGDINGAALFIPEDVIRNIGLFKENYFLYLEETEYCLRAKKAGTKLMYAPESIVYHAEGATTGTHSKYNFVIKKNTKVDYLMLRNRTYMVREHYKYTLPLYLLTVPLLMLKRLVDGRWRTIPNMVEAIRAGLTNPYV